MTNNVFNSPLSNDLNFRHYKKKVILQTHYDLMIDFQSDILYEIDGFINTKGVQIIPPLGGVYFKGGLANTSGFYCEEDNYTLFIGNTGGIVLNGLSIEITGANSKVFGIDNTAGTVLDSSAQFTTVNNPNYDKTGYFYDFNGINQYATTNVNIGGKDTLQITVPFEMDNSTFVVIGHSNSYGCQLKIATNKLRLEISSNNLSNDIASNVFGTKNYFTGNRYKIRYTKTLTQHIFDYSESFDGGVTWSEWVNDITVNSSLNIYDSSLFQIGADTEGTFAYSNGRFYLNELEVILNGETAIFPQSEPLNGGFDELSMTDCNFNNCTSLGTITGYRQGFWANIGIINCLDGITLAGDWLGGFRATSSIVLNMPSGGVAFRAGADLVFNNRFITDMNFSNIQAGATAIDFRSTNFTNDNTFIIRDATFTGAGGYVPNTLPSNDVALFTNNTGLEDTYIGGIWVLNTEVETVIPTANTPVIIAGTTVYNSLAHFTSNGNNSLEKTTTQPVQVDVKCNLAFAGSNGDEVIVHIYKWDNEAQAYIEVKQSGGDTVNQGGKAEGVNLNYPVSMKILDRIELRVSNATAGRNLTLLANSDCQISKR